MVPPLFVNVGAPKNSLEMLNVNREHRRYRSFYYSTRPEQPQLVWAKLYLRVVISDGGEDGYGQEGQRLVVARQG